MSSWTEPGDAPLDDDPRDQTPTRLQNLPSRLLTHTAWFADRLVTEELARVGARRWHYAVLVSLQEAGPASQATLSRRAGLYRSDLVAVINELAEPGYVERALDPEDRRRNIITITTAGRRHLRRLDKVIDAIQANLLAPLSAAERTQFLRALARVQAHLAGSE